MRIAEEAACEYPVGEGRDLPDRGTVERELVVPLLLGGRRHDPIDTDHVHSSMREKPST